jgi:hypothetical protein
MNDGSWHLLYNLTVNAAAYLDDHPVVSKAAIAFTLAAGCYAIVAARAWSVSICSDRSLRRLLHVCAMAGGGCLFLTGLFYDSLTRGLDGAITYMPLIYVYYPASITLSCAAMVFALAQVYCALNVRPASLMRGIIPGLLGAWLFALAVPVYQFSVILRGVQ